jgi:ribosomal protein S18 acetylase RimI-like enzyme
MELTKLHDQIILDDSPRIPGLRFRRFRGEVDYPFMLRISQACMKADNIPYTNTLEEIANYYAHLQNCDPFQDMVFAEIDDEMIGYSRVFWEKLNEGIRVYTLFGNILPEWRRAGIGTAMLLFNEERLRTVASDHPQDGSRFFQSWAADTEIGTEALLKSQDYKPIRYSFDMVRDLSQPIPDAPLPEGLEIRPVEEDHIWPIFRAANEAFRDHWGFRPTADEEFEGWMKDPCFHPELWKVAWDGDQIAGSVQNFINLEENKEHNRKRGYTEGISTRRPWRKRGLASALITESMKMFKKMGMTETAHGVDAENTSGALRLYKKLGYKVVKQYTTFRKPLK